MNKFKKLFVMTTTIVLILVMMPVNISAASSKLVVSTTLGESPYTRTFKVYNPTGSDMTYDYEVKGESTSKDTGTVAAGQTKAHVVNCGKEGDVSFVLQDNLGNISSPVKGLAQYNLKVYYRYNNGNIKDMTYSVCSKSNNAKVTAPTTINKDGRVYTIDNNYREVAYGSEQVVFEYKLQARAGFTSQVVMLDQDGNTLKRDSFAVTEDNGGSYDVPNKLNQNGRSYILMNGYGDISQKYDDGAKSFYVRYQLQEDAESLPYYINIDYKVENTLLTRKTLTVQKGQTVKHEAPSIYQVGTSSYKLTGDGKISHTFGADERNYTIQYSRNITDSNQPYDININYIDIATGKVLKTDSKKVDVNKTVTAEMNGTVNVGGKTYVLSTNQPRTISHKFGDSQTVYSVYFNEKDVNVDNYDVRVSYYDLTNNKILYTTVLKTNIDNVLKIDVPERYKDGNTEFVLLSGQEKSINHEFYSTRRSYTFIFRDVEDLLNQDVVVLPGIDQDTVTTPDNRNVVIDNNTGNTVITIPGNDVPLVIGPNGELEPGNRNEDVTIDENKVPLANAFNTNSPLFIGGGIVGIATLGIIILFVVKKRKKGVTKKSI